MCRCIKCTCEDVRINQKFHSYLQYQLIKKSDTSHELWWQHAFRIKTLNILHITLWVRCCFFSFIIMYICSLAPAPTNTFKRTHDFSRLLNIIYLVKLFSDNIPKANCWARGTLWHRHKLIRQKWNSTQNICHFKPHTFCQKL